MCIRDRLESRSEVEYENYSKAINIEARTMYDMASKSIIPAVIKYTTPVSYTHLDVYKRQG